MIFYLATKNHFGSPLMFLRDWGTPLLKRVRLLAYEDLPAAASLPAGTYVFTDMERLGPQDTARAADLWKDLAARGPAVRLLNRPGRYMRRYELLRTLHALGRNSFNVFRALDPRPDVRYPVFVRHTDLHEGAYTPLLPDAHALGRAVDELVAAGHDRDRLLVVEYLDTADSTGMYRKYSALCIGSRIIPHHVMFGRDWLVKGPTLDDPAMMAEERAFQQTNPHETQLRELFQLANVAYGRADYAVVDGRIQVWEINTNPTLLYPRHRYQPHQLPAKLWLTDQVCAAFESLDGRGQTNGLAGRAFDWPRLRPVGRSPRRPLVPRLVSWARRLVRTG